MIRTELIIQLLKVVIGLAFGAHFVWWSLQVLEPISKSPEEDNEAGDLNKAQEVLGVVLPTDEEPTLPLDLGEKALKLRHDLHWGITSRISLRSSGRPRKLCLLRCVSPLRHSADKLPRPATALRGKGEPAAHDHVASAVECRILILLPSRSNAHLHLAGQ